MTIYYAEFKHTKAIPHTNLGSSRQVFRNLRGNNRSYKFFVDVDGSLKYQWYNDTIWSSSIDVHTSGDVTAFDTKVHDTGTLLDVYVVLIDYTNADLTYRKGTIGDSDDTITWSSAQDIDTALDTTLLEYKGCGITRTDNGELVVGWMEFISGTGNTARIIGSDGDGASPTWSGETQVNTQSSKDSSYVMGVESFSSAFGDRFVIYFENVETDFFRVYVYDWDQGGSGFGSIANDSITSAGGAFRGLSASIDSNDKVHVAWINIENDVRHARYPNIGGLGNESIVNVVALTAPESPEAVSLTIDQTNDEVYVFYKKHSETANFYYKKSDVTTISFGSETTITIAEDIDYISTGQRDQDGKIVIVSSPEV